MLELTPDQEIHPGQYLRDFTEGKRDYLLMDTVLRLMLAATVQLDARLTKLEARDV